MFLENKPGWKPKPKGIDVNFERLVMLVCMSGLRGDDDVPDVLLSIARNWGFSQLGTILGVPIIRTRIFMGVCWGALFLGNYQIIFQVTQKDT